MSANLMALHCKMRRTTIELRKTRSHNKQTQNILSSYLEYHSIKKILRLAKHDNETYATSEKATLTL